jgi:signal transduction histidine kinase
MRASEELRSHVPGPVPGTEGSLARALLQGLNTPLAALRATMETLGQEMLQSGHTVKPLRIDGVLREVDLLGKNVRGLCELATPPVPLPLACSLEEIVSAARSGLPLELRARVIAARTEPGASIEVDGPLLSVCLRRLLENALEASDGPVLVVARRENGQATLSVIDDAPSSLGPGWQPVPFHSTKPNHIGLGLTLTRRDVALLDGRLEFLSMPDGATCVRITIPSKENDR